MAQSQTEMGGTAQLPLRFQKSWNDFRSYPENYVETKTATAANEALKRRLDDDDVRLFSKENVEVVARDLQGIKIAMFCGIMLMDMR